MKNILSKTKTAIILLIVTVLLLGSYVCIVANPVTYGMKYRNETVYEGQAFVGALKYSIRSAKNKLFGQRGIFGEYSIFV